MAKMQSRFFLGAIDAELHFLSRRQSADNAIKQRRQSFIWPHIYHDADTQCHYFFSSA